MNLQFNRLTGLAIILSIAGIAQAQVVTHTELNSTASDHGVTFTAHVSDSTGNPATAGIVTIENAQGASLGSAFVKDGEATVNVDQGVSGNVYATYSGSSGFRSSTAQVQASANASTLPDFTVSANPTSLSLSPGQFGTIVVTITPINGFNNMVSLSCSGNPPASTCTFSPTTLTPLKGAPVTSSLQIATQGASGTLVWPNRAPGHSSHIAYAIVLPGILALVGLGALRKRSGLNAIRMLGLAVLLTAGTLALSGCSQLYDYYKHPPEPNSGIAAGNYTVTIAAYSNNGASVTSHTITIALTIK